VASARLIRKNGELRLQVQQTLLTCNNIDLSPYRKTKIAAKKGWQRERSLNFDSYVTDSAEEGQENLVADGWTEMPSYSAVIGSPRWPIVEPTPEAIQQHIARLHKLDLAHSERVRRRTEEIVKDPETAAKLKAWYPSWFVTLLVSSPFTTLV
jgi:hypothetical protein